jgi:hypothetical protein
MPTIWPNSAVLTLETIFDRKRVATVAEEVRRAVEPLMLPDAAKVLTAIAVDVVAATQSRNDRRDVNEALAALRRALALLEAIELGLDG